VGEKHCCGVKFIAEQKSLFWLMNAVIDPNIECGIIG
jgi:hypothetical protein